MGAYRRPAASGPLSRGSRSENRSRPWLTGRPVAKVLEPRAALLPAPPSAPPHRLARQTPPRRHPRGHRPPRPGADPPAHPPDDHHPSSQSNEPVSKGPTAWIGVDQRAHEVLGTSRPAAGQEHLRPVGDQRSRGRGQRKADHADHAGHRVHFDGGAVGHPSKQVGDADYHGDTQLTAENRRVAEQATFLGGHGGDVGKMAFVGARGRGGHQDVARLHPAQRIGVVYDRGSADPDLRAHTDASQRFQEAPPAFVERVGGSGCGPAARRADVDERRGRRCPGVDHGRRDALAVAFGSRRAGDAPARSGMTSVASIPHALHACARSPPARSTRRARNGACHVEEMVDDRPGIRSVRAPRGAAPPGRTPARSSRRCARSGA